MAKKVNILFFLLPKNNVEYVYDNYSIRQVLEKMDFHRYSAIPIISKDGKFFYQQNFVPVVDDYGSFIGIITRKKVIEYLISKINSNESDDDLTY